MDALTDSTNTLSAINLPAGHILYEPNKDSVDTAVLGQASWVGGPGDHAFDPEHTRHGSASSTFQWNGHEFGLLSEPSFDLTDPSSKSPTQQLSTSNLELSSATMPSDHLQPSHINYHPGIIRAPYSTVGRTNHQGPPERRDHPQADAGKAPSLPLPNPGTVSSELGTMRYPIISDNFSETQLPVASPPEASVAAATGRESSVEASSTQVPPTSPSATSEEVDDVPGIDSTVEEKFEYLLAYARRVGFNGFDALTSQYYTLNFDHTSPLALEQRTSRNRHLPAILAELRQRSRNWMPWERHGYQAEILKSAEEICTAECSNFRKREDSTQVAYSSEMILQDKVSVPTFHFSIIMQLPIVEQGFFSRIQLKRQMIDNVILATKSLGATGWLDI